VALEQALEKWTGKITEVTIGATREEGGTRSAKVVAGGESTLPFLTFEGEVPHQPVIAGEILDRYPEEWPSPLREAFGEDLKDPAAWARRWVEGYGAQLLCLRLASTAPDAGDASPEQAAATVRRVLEAVGAPLIILGSEDVEKDNAIFPKVAEAAAGERCFLGVVTKDNYKSIAAAAMLHGHGLIAQAPVDVNIQKQTNILLLEFGVKKDSILMDPTTGGLGYGLEYTYSVMERLRLGALQGEAQVAVPLILFPGAEAWRSKEAKESTQDSPRWGEQETRGVLWEILTGTNSLQAGGDILVCRHPEAAAALRRHVAELLV
jgi:acetyl-CoA decarbonylase/synthase complex subunit delta